ncbi:MAG: hypothetical protein KJO40_05020 [Deltaproteobacteria bacterium]|nr:hypothetical protein [Deltaproteobacteria bacterium]MBT8464760.1 hypothetical protein [Deltaproteobacteria bacterium]MBT8482654.1 hypothetical protein [Deltaproteobacteria bacterium]NNK06709.1 hypothetical protein [Myxococcales bacterium]NNL25515.1 hypothetical protein [Myxococcales bacterium]
MRPIRLAWILSFFVLAASCAGTQEDGGPVASLELGFELADGSQVDEVAYSIGGNGIDPIEGVIDTRAPESTSSIEVFGIPAGDRYLVTLRATTRDGATTCGGSTRFDVLDGVATAVQVMLGCKRGARFGGVRINGDLNVCAELTKVITSPLQTSIANGMMLNAEGSDAEGDPVAYRWRGTGGSLSNPSAAVTTFTCEEAGPQTVEIEVSDDGFEYCVDSYTVDVTCVMSGANGGEPTPALSESNPGEGDTVVPSAWLRLGFAEEVADGALDGFSLRCDGQVTNATVHRLGADGRTLILNPVQGLPANAACSLAWLGSDGPNSLGFDTYPQGPSSAVPYDRTDASRTAPFPDDLWLVADSASPTGRRLDVPIPDRERDIQRVLTALKFALGAPDGFSPLGPLVVELPEAPDPASLPRQPAESLEPLATVGLFDVDPDSAQYGERVPFELYIRSMSTRGNPEVQHALVLFPSIPLTPRSQYALVVTKRALADLDRAFAPSAFMSAALAPLEASEPEQVTAVRDVIAPALAGLSDASPPVFAEDIALVTRFTVRSTDAFPLTPLAMKEQARSLPPPTFTIERVERGFGDVAAIVEGTWEAPEWREGQRIVRDEDGLPVLVGTKPIPFVLAIPRAATTAPVPVTMYQHGNPGSAEAEVPNQAQRYLARGGHAVIGFTDTVNREIGSDTQLQQAATLGPLLVDGVIAEFDMQTLGEQLAFIRFVEELRDLDVVPFGNPDGQPDLDVSEPLTYDGISAGSVQGQVFVPYAPEVVAAALVVGAGRAAEILFYQDIINPDGVGSPLMSALTLFAPNLRPIDMWLGMSLYQIAIDSQDQHNHASFMYANPIEVGGTTKKPSVLVQEGIGDTFIPNNATRSLAYALGSTPLVGRVAQPVPYLERADAPLVANVDSQTTSAYSQYVPNGIPGLNPTPGCEFWDEGHFCAQTARAALDQRMTFFRTALTDDAPTVVDGPVNLCDAVPSCDDDNPCTADRCEPSTGECINSPQNRRSCEIDGVPGICLLDMCTPLQMCSMLEDDLQTATGALSCNFFGFPLELSATLGTQRLGPLGPGPVEYTVQTALALEASAIDFLGIFGDTADVLRFESVVASTGGSVDPAPVTTTQGIGLCQVTLDAPADLASFASEPTAATWFLEDDATFQEITLEDIDLTISVSGLDADLTTSGPNPSCLWETSPPRLVEMP